MVLFTNLISGITGDLLNGNRSKSREIIFTDKRRKRSFQTPSLLPTITRVSAIKILIIIIIIFIRSWQTATNYKNELIDQSINAFVQHSENEISQLINWCRHIEQSVCLWTCNSIASCAQTVHALRLLRSNGMSLECIYTVYIERSSSPSSPYTHLVRAWWGFTTAADRQRLEAVIRTAIRSELCDPASYPWLNSWQPLMTICSFKSCKMINMC